MQACQVASHRADSGLPISDDCCQAGKCLAVRVQFPGPLLVHHLQQRQQFLVAQFGIVLSFNQGAPWTMVWCCCECVSDDKWVPEPGFHSLPHTRVVHGRRRGVCDEAGQHKKNAVGGACRFCRGGGVAPFLPTGGKGG